MYTKSFLKQVLFSLFISLNIIIVRAQNNDSYNKIILSSDIRTGAEQTERYLPWIKGKNIAVVANQSSLINKTFSVSYL